jgi:hypothetical protein
MKSIAQTSSLHLSDKKYHKSHMSIIERIKKTNTERWGRFMRKLLVYTDNDEVVMV